MNEAALARGVERPRVAVDGVRSGRRAARRRRARPSRQPAAHRAAFEAYQARLGPLHPETLSAAHGLAMMLKNTQHYAEAEALLRATFEARKLKLGGGRRGAAAETALELGEPARRSGLLEEAEPFLRVTHDARRAKLGPEHDQTLDAANDLARCSSSSARCPRPRRSTARRTPAPARRGGDDELTINSAMSLALLSSSRPRGTRRRRSSTARAYDARTRTLGAAHGQTRDTGRELSGVLARLGRIREANALKDKCQEENANPFSCYSAASAAETSPASRRNRERFAFATACYAARRRRRNSRHAGLQPTIREALRARTVSRARARPVLLRGRREKTIA